MKKSKSINKFDETILQILLDKSLTFTELKEKLKTTDPTLSRHLKNLEEMFLITKTEEKRYSLTEPGKEFIKKISIKRRIKGMVIGYFIKEINPIISLLDYLNLPLFFKQKCFIKKFPIFNLLRYYIALLYIEPIIKEYNNAEEYIKDVKDFWKIIKDKEYYVADVKFSWKKAIINVLNDIKYEKERSKGIKKEALEYVEKIIKENEERIFEDFNGYSKNENKWCLSIEIKHSHKIKLSILSGIFFFIIKIAILYLIFQFLIGDISYLNAVLNIFNLSLFAIAFILFLIEIGVSFILIAHRKNFIVKMIIGWFSFFIYSFFIFMIIPFIFTLFSNVSFNFSLENIKKIMSVLIISHFSLAIVSDFFILPYYKILKKIYYEKEVIEVLWKITKGKLTILKPCFEEKLKNIEMRKKLRK